MKKVLKTADALLFQILKWILVFLVLVMFVLLIIQILFRYVLLLPSPWSEEIARLALVWMVFLAAALGVRKLEHPQIDMLTRHFPLPVRRIVEILVYGLIIAFSFVIIKYGIEYAQTTKMDLNTSLRYPKNFFYWPAPVGGVLMVAYSLVHLVNAVIGKPGEPIEIMGEGDKTS